MMDKKTNKEYLKNDGRIKEVLSASSRVWQEAGIIEKAPDLSSAFTDKYIQQAEP